MNISILGAGSVGGTLGKKWSYKDHRVTFGVRNPQAKKITILLSECARGSRALPIDSACDDADIVVLAIPWSAVQPIVMSTDLSEKIIIDCTNPIGAGLRLTVGHHNSGGEQVAQWASGAKVVKAFNSTGWENMANPVYGETPLTMFYCGDDEVAKNVTETLVQQIGFEPWDVGELAMARYLEPLAVLWIHEAIVRGRGRNIALKMIRRDID